MSPVELLRSPTLTDSAPYACAARAGDLALTAGVSDLQKSGTGASNRSDVSARCHLSTSGTPGRQPA